MSYDTDFVAWTAHQADLLRRRATGELPNDTELDWLNIAEEIESAGRSETREVRSRVAVLLCHLLKWAYQPEHRSSSWRGTISVQRRELLAVLADSPSLRGCTAGVLGGAYANARQDAVAEAGLMALPETCQWTLEQILDGNFWP